MVLTLKIENEINRKLIGCEIPYAVSEGFFYLFLAKTNETIQLKGTTQLNHKRIQIFPLPLV